MVRLLESCCFVFVWILFLFSVLEFFLSIFNVKLSLVERVLWVITLTPWSWMVVLISCLFPIVLGICCPPPLRLYGRRLLSFSLCTVSRTWSIQLLGAVVISSPKCFAVEWQQIWPKLYYSLISFLSWGFLHAWWLLLNKAFVLCWQISHPAAVRLLPFALFSILSPLHCKHCHCLVVGSYVVSVMFLASYLNICSAKSGDFSSHSVSAQCE